jgi:propanediol dehydratase small subunit
MIPAILGAVGSIAGPAIVGAVGTIAGAAMANSANRSINSSQQGFTREMRLTAYQDTMQDMRKAGLNPILAASRGATQSSIPNMIPMQNPAAGFAQAMSSAADVRLKQEQTNIAMAEVEKKLQEIISEKIRNGRIVLQDMTTGEITDGLLQQQIAKDAALAQYYGNQAELDGILLEFYNSNEPAKIAKDLGVTPNTVKSIFQLLFGGKRK